MILDTNVLSALMQQKPPGIVVAWLDEQPAESIWISSVTLFEARYGLELLPASERRNILQQRFEQFLREDIQNRVAHFDSHDAIQSAELAAARKASGRPVDMRDTFIAGIALARRAAIITRNTRHFDDLSVPVVNPWGDSE